VQKNQDNEEILVGPECQGGDCYCQGCPIFILVFLKKLSYSSYCNWNSNMQLVLIKYAIFFKVPVVNTMAAFTWKILFFVYLELVLAPKGFAVCGLGSFHPTPELLICVPMVGGNCPSLGVFSECLRVGGEEQEQTEP
jgi:hypothetical protein